MARSKAMLFEALIWRPLRQDWGRTLLSLLAIALGVAVVVAIRVANRAAVGSFQRTTSALAGGADLLATGPEPLPAALLPRLFALNAQAETAPYLDRWAYDAVHHDTLEVLGIDLLGSAQGILLPPAYAGVHGLKAGDALTLVAAGRPARLRVAGVLPASSTASVASLAILDLPAALAAFEPDAPPQFDGLRITLAPGARAASIEAGLQPLLPAADGVSPPSTQVAQDAAMLGAFRANLQALSFVSLLVGIFLIYNTVSISVVRRRPAIATLRALGATRGRVLALFVGEGTVLALLGGGLGLALGWLLASGALALMQRTISNLYAPTTAASAALTLGDAAWGFAVALAAGAVAAWAPARQAAGVRPAAALRAGSAETRLRRRRLGAGRRGGAAGPHSRRGEPALAGVCQRTRRRAGLGRGHAAPARPRAARAAPPLPRPRPRRRGLGSGLARRRTPPQRGAHGRGRHRRGRHARRRHHGGQLPPDRFPVAGRATAERRLRPRRRLGPQPSGSAPAGVAGRCRRHAGCGRGRRQPHPVVDVSGPADRAQHPLEARRPRRPAAIPFPRRGSRPGAG